MSVLECIYYAMQRTDVTLIMICQSTQVCCTYAGPMGWPPYPVPHPYHPVHLGAAHQLMGLSQVSIGQPSQIMQPGTAQTAGAATLGMLPAGLPGSIQGAERPPAAHGRVAGTAANKLTLADADSACLTAALLQACTSCEASPGLACVDTVGLSSHMPVSPCVCLHACILQHIWLAECLLTC